MYFMYDFIIIIIIIHKFAIQIIGLV